MSASLVGSEMCIRDRSTRVRNTQSPTRNWHARGALECSRRALRTQLLGARPRSAHCSARACFGAQRAGAEHAGALRVATRVPSILR
eukprot:13966417-Alexandrium_andersonii.AAC.1